MFSPLSWHRTTQQNDNAGICEQSIEHANILLLLNNNNITFRIHTAQASASICLSVNFAITTSMVTYAALLIHVSWA